MLEVSEAWKVTYACHLCRPRRRRAEGTRTHPGLRRLLQALREDLPRPATTGIHRPEGQVRPSVAALVEAMFIAELKNLLLTAGHDLDAVELPLKLDIARGGERYTP